MTRSLRVDLPASYNIDMCIIPRIEFSLVGTPYARVPHSSTGKKLVSYKGQLHSINPKKVKPMNECAHNGCTDPVVDEKESC